ncbi:CARDB domain-containing protein, partial [Algoriphagus zhangzhouensis]
MFELQSRCSLFNHGTFSKSIYFFTLLFLLPVLSLFAQAPTVPSSNFSVSNIDGSTFYVSFSAGDGQKRIIIASENPVTASPSNGVDYTPGNFGLGNEIAPGQFVVYDGASSGTWLYGFSPATTYYLKIVEYNGIDFSTEYLTSDFLLGEVTTISGPTVQASNLLFSNVTGNSMNLNWTNGDGWGRTIIARAGAEVNVEPEDLVNYSYSQNFGLGSDMGDGNFVVYSGTGSTMNLSNLATNTTYHFKIFEYKGNSGRVYLRPGFSGSQQTGSEPTVPASNFYTSNVDGNRFYYGFSAGNGTRRLVVAKLGSPVSFVPEDGQSYTGSTTFGSGQEVATGEFVVYEGTSSGSWLYGLQTESTYYFSIFESNGSGTQIDYLQSTYLSGIESTINRPTVQTSNLVFSNVTGNSIGLSWTNGDGWGRIIIARADAEVNIEPEDLINYSPSSSFGAGSNLGDGNYVVFNGGGSSLNLSNLDPNRTYHFKIFEYRGNNGRLYLRPGITGSQLTASEPTTPASNFYTSNVDGNRFFYGFSAGNGTRRLVIAKLGSPVSFVPEDGQTYTASTTFGSGQEVSAGEFVVYEGTSSGSWIYGLQTESTYHFSVFESNGTGAERDYLQNPYLTGSQSTINRPTVQVSNLQFSNVTGNSIGLSWTNGDGWGRTIIARPDSEVNVEPEDLTNYSPSSSFGSGSSLGDGNYVVFNGSGSSMTLSNVDPNRTYHFKIFEYRGNNGRLYLRPGLSGNQLTGTAPTVPASNFYTSNVDGDRFYYGFTKGNGTKRVVIAKAGSPVTFTPEDGQTYSGSTTFGSGQEVSLDEFVVYEGTGSGSWLYGLIPGTEYHFAIFEHNGDGQYYLIDPYLEAFQATLGTPTVQSSSAFTSSRSNTSINISWTKGNGSNRILLGRKDGPVNVEPSDLSSYSSSSVFGQREIGTGNYVLYSSSGNAVNITNLEPGTNYHFALFEYNGSSAKMYLRPGYQFSLETYGERPTVQTSNASFSQITNDSFTVDFTKGNGSGRIVLAKAGSPVDAGPSDFTSYNSNGHFAWGDEIGNGNFVIYQGSDETFLLEGLSAGTVYYLAFFEYAMSASGELYLAPAYTSSQETLTPIDLALTTLINPLSDCELSSGEEVQVEISNLTEYPVDYIKLSYSINGGDPVIEELSQIDLIPSNGTYTFTFNQLADLSIDQVYQFEVNLMIEDDLDPSNDMIQIEVENYADLVTSITPNTSINQGESLLLEASGGLSYLWSTGESSSQITVQPTETTTFTVVITGENGCQVERSVLVEVIPDLCYNVTCPPGYTCYEGSCYATFVTVTGTVRDLDTATPLENVAVTNGGVTVFTAPDGTYSIEAQVLTDLTFELAGYQSQSLEVPDEAAPVIDVDLENPCYNVTCPPGYTCYEGSCFATFVTVTGTVKDVDTASPLENVAVTNGGTTVFTAPDGTYSIEAQVLSDLTFELTGYQSQSFEVPDESTPIIDAELIADACWGVVCPPGYTCYEGSCFATFVTVTGTVRDLATASPLENVAVTNGGITVFTAPDGTYSIEAQVLTDLTFELTGYQSQSIEVPDEAAPVIDVDLENPCYNVTCPPGYTCYEGSCFATFVTVTGTVRDADTAAPLDNVAVTNGGTTVFTAPDGTYSIEAQVLSDLTFELTGYQSQSFEVLDESNPIIDAELIADACWGVVCPPGYTCYEGSCYATFVTVTGTVRDLDTATPLENVAVTNGGITVFTASDGSYSIEAQVLTDLTFELAGYQSQSIEVLDEVAPVIDVDLENPCYNVTCPPGYTCYEGSCFATFVTVTGTVRDADTAAPLENVVVRNGAMIVYTAPDGTYSIEAQVLTDLTFELTGYQSQSFEIPDESAPIINIDLENPCFNSTCPEGFVCYQGSCYPEEDPCLGVTCPIGYSCYEGSCFATFVTVTGTVRDADTASPLADVAVSNGGETVFTSSEGTYSIEIQVLTNLSFELEGYETQSIQVPDQESPVIDVDLISNPCYNITCPDGYICYQGSCYLQEDPCSGVICPEGYECYEGSCFPKFVTVTGTVRDADSLTPLQGVAVGDGNTTVFTAPDGTYNIEAQVIGDLIFSLTSYNSQTIQVPNESNPVIDVDLLSLCSNLSCPEGYACYEGSCFPIACQSELGELTFSPALGDGETEFVFSITYTDPDEIALALGYPRLILEEINSSGTFETSYILEELDPSDENLADGKVYQILISDLNPASTFRAKVEASNLLACDQASDWIAGPTLSDSDIDLGIFANNISFSNENPNAFEPITVFARVRNYSGQPVENISVTAYDGDIQIFNTIIPTLNGNANIDLSWPYSFESAGFYPIKVVIDEANEIQEINELNNFAIRPVLVGDYVLPGGMEVEASMNSYTVYPGQYVTLNGLAQYFGIDDGVNPDVVGAAVEIQWANGTVNLTTRGDGSFSQSFKMPSVPGTYMFSGQVTDYTLTGEIAPMEVEVIPFPNKPDLIAAVELDELEILQGQAVTGRATITNAGDATAYNFLFQWRNCEIQLGEELIGSLAPGESLSFEFSTQISALGNCFNKNNCYFQAVADPGNQVDEKSKSNNSRIRYVTVYPNAPDLTVSQSYTPSSSKMESPTQVYVRVDNIGGIAVENTFTVNTYVDGSLVDIRDFPGLEPCAKINYTLNLDFELLEDHLVEIKVDEPIGSGQIAEHKEDNNEYSKLIRYVAPPVLYPNLNVQINDLTVNPISPLENQDFEINAVFRNNGSAPVTEDIAIRWIINESGSETVIDDIWTGGLAVGETAQISAPANLNAYGNHFVRLQLDPANTIAESYETDNKAEMPLCTDFEAIQVGNVWNGGFFVNTQQYLTLKVKNKGLFTATNVNVAFELDGFQIAETTLPSVPPSYSGSGVSVSIPYVFTESGTFVLKAIIDGEDQWIECNEGNNTWSKSITVKGPQPDLRILSEFISPTELNPEPDEQVQIFLSFENIGVVDAGPFKLRLLMDDQILGQDISVSGLGAGKISTVAIPTPYSSSTAGIKVMKGQVDPDQLANDVNYNNNEATRALVVGTAPNLYFENISFSYLCPKIGDEISIHVDIFNEGDLASNAELEFAYITDNDTIPIETKAIFVDLQSGISESINWTVVNPEYPILARIKNSDPQEFNVLDNGIVGEIKDIIPPTLLTQNLELFLDESGLVNLVAEDFDNGSYDEGCGIESMTLDQNSLDCSVLDTWIPLQFTATDFAGNSSSQEVLVMVKDNILPTIENMPASIVVGNDPGNCTAIVSWIEPIALDNCSGSSIQQITGQPNGSAFGLGEHLILYQAVDASGNTIQNGFTITVSDTEAPSLVAPANIIVGTDPGLCEASNVDLGEAQSGDNCGGVQVTNDAPTIFPLG